MPSKTVKFHPDQSSTALPLVPFKILIQNQIKSFMFLTSTKASVLRQVPEMWIK